MAQSLESLVVDLLANIHRDPKKQKAFTADDFLGTGKEREPEKVTGGLPDPRMSAKNQSIYMSLFFASQRLRDGERRKDEG